MMAQMREGDVRGCNLEFSFNCWGTFEEILSQVDEFEVDF
jgi:hypothetical protein